MGDSQVIGGHQLHETNHELMLLGIRLPGPVLTSSDLA